MVSVYPLFLRVHGQTVEVIAFLTLQTNFKFKCLFSKCYLYLYHYLFHPYILLTCFSDSFLCHVLFSDWALSRYLQNWHEQDTCDQWRTQEFFSGGGGSTISVEDRGHWEREFWGSSPLVRGSTLFANGWTRILIRLLQMYFPQNREFGSALSKLWNFGGGEGVEHPKPSPSVCHCLWYVLHNWVISCTLLVNKLPVSHRT
jgi:hypothetical protein